MDTFTQVPVYEVKVTTHLLAGIQQWSRMQRTGFLAETEALGRSGATRNLRHAGGKAVWIIVGDYHMTYFADPDTKVITVMAARPCTHQKGKCPP